MAWIHRNAKAYGGDPDKLFVMGHSAGANIAALLAFDDRYLVAAGLSPGCIRGFIGLAGPYALETGPAFLRGVFSAPYSPDDWQPIRRVTATAPPTLVLHGQGDWMVEADESIELANRLASLGVPAYAHVYPGRSHRDLLTAWWRPLQHRTPVLKDTRAFIQSVINERPRSPCTGDPVSVDIRASREI